MAATWRLQSNLDTSPLDLGDGTGPEAGPLDILVMGTDTRDGEGNDRYGDDEDSAGDTDDDGTDGAAPVADEEAPGAEIGMSEGEGSSFEPEEDPEA